MSIMDYNFGNDVILDFLHRLASKKSVPGGGSASCVTSAIGTALITKALLFSEKNLPKADFEKYITDLKELLSQFVSLANKDASAYNAVVEVMKNKSLSEKEKEQRKEEALVYAAKVPLDGAELITRVADIAEHIKAAINPRVKSDFDIGVALIKTSLYGFEKNVLINISEIKNAAIKDNLQNTLTRITNRLEIS